MFDHICASLSRHVVLELEQQQEEKFVAMREELLRSKITSIIHCDIYGDPLLSVPHEPFDIVSCNNTLGPVSDTLDEFRQNCRKLSELVKPGGFLTMLQSEEGSYYKVADKTEENFHSLFITQDEFHDAAENAGFTVVMNARKDAPITPKNVPGNRKGVMFLAAQKNFN